MKKYLTLFFICILGFCMTACGNIDGKEENDTTTKLNKFTEFNETDKSFSYNDSSDKWTLIYSEENILVRFYNDQLTDIFLDYFGTDCFENDEYKGFTYDLNENKANMYFNEYVTGLSIITYDIDNDEFILTKEGYDIDPSESFLDFTKSNDIAGIIKDTVKRFDNILNDNELDLQEILSLSFE